MNECMYLRMDVRTYVHCMHTHAHTHTIQQTGSNNNNNNNNDNNNNHNHKCQDGGLFFLVSS